MGQDNLKGLDYFFPAITHEVQLSNSGYLAATISFMRVGLDLITK